MEARCHETDHRGRQARDARRGRPGGDRNGARGPTATGVLGFGQQHGHLDTHQDEDADAALLPKVRLDIVVNDDVADTLLDAIVQSARTGAIGDGKLWLTPVESVVRVRTGELDANVV